MTKFWNILHCSLLKRLWCQYIYICTIHQLYSHMTRFCTTFTHHNCESRFFQIWIINQGGLCELSFPSFHVLCELWASYEQAPCSRQNELRFFMYNIMQDNIHPIYRVCLINSKSCSFSTSCKHITFFFIFMNIVTHSLEASGFTLSESENE